MYRRRSRSRGFTLMEILLVLAILVVLGAMVGVGYSRVQDNAMKSAARTQIGLLEDATKLYVLDVGSYLVATTSDAPPPWSAAVRVGAIAVPKGIRSVANAKAVHCAMLPNLLGI